MLLCLFSHRTLDITFIEFITLLPWLFLPLDKSSLGQEVSFSHLCFFFFFLVPNIVLVSSITSSQYRFHPLSKSCCSVTKLCLTLCDPMDCSMPNFPVLHYLLESTHSHWVGDTIQLSHPLLPPSLPAFSLSQYQDLFQWVGYSYQVAKVLEFSFFQWILRVDFL